MLTAGTNPAPRGDALLTADHVTVEFPARRRATVHAVTDVTISLRPGETLSLVGESGCGKSTLGRTLLGLLPPAEGDVLLDGLPILGRARVRELRRRVQMIFQDPYQTLNPRMTVRAIVAEPLRIRGVPKAQHAARVAQAMADVRLGEQLLDRHPHQLSGGQRQRVAIAAALVLEPEALICDEPVSMLDVSVRTQILDVLLDLRSRRELTLLFVTHDLSLAWAICDRIAVMYLGRVVEQGPAAQVIEQPQHPYTRALVDAVPVPKPGGGGRRELLSGELPDAARVPTGCRFHPRCPRRFDPCDHVDPPLLAAGPGDQRAACLLLDPAHGAAAAGGPAAPAAPSSTPTESR